MPLNEGQTVQYTVITTRVADGTVLYWRTTGNTTNSDIVGGNTGSVTITNNQGVFNVTTSTDSNTDGTKTLGISLSTGSISGPTVVSTANPITVNDTSLSPEYRLFSFGDNSQGQLGFNDTVYRSSPTQVGTAINWSKVVNSRLCTMAIKTDGTLWTWGYNNSSTKGQLGLNNIENVSSPTQVGTDTNWNDICLKTTYGYGAAAIKSDGTLWTWGDNDYGQMGVGNRINRSSPVQVGSLTNWSKVAVGYYHTIAKKIDGTLWSWGYGFNGQLGLNAGFVYASRSSPVQIGTDTNWNQIDAGQVHNIATKTDGTLWAWGGNFSGQLGQNNLINRSSPVQVGSATDWQKISAGASNNAAIKTNGILLTWGINYSGHLGQNNTVYRSSPTQVGTGTDWSQVESGGTHMVAIKNDGTLWGWGLGSKGQLGNNIVTNYSSPVQIGTGTNWYQISAGSDATVGIASSV